MIRVSSSKIKDLAKELNGIEILGIHFKQEGEVKGIQVLLSTDTDDAEKAKSAVKNYLKEHYPALKIYVEVL